MRHIRKGTSRVTIPFQLRSTSKAMAQWANQVRQGMLELRDRIPQANIGRGGGGASDSPFWVSIRVQKGSPPENPIYEITVGLGYVTYQNANANDIIGYIVPTIGGVKLDAKLDNPEAVIPALALSGMANYIYINVKTTADGDPKLGAEDIKIIVSEEIKDSTHHVRPSPSGGETEGDYFFLIAETEAIPDSDPPRPRIKRRITGNRFIPNQLIEILNLGDAEGDSKKYELYEGYLPGQGADKHQFRVLEQVGTGKPIIRPLKQGKPAVPPQTDASGNVIKPGEPAVPPEAQGETIRFKSLETPSDSELEILSEEDDDTIKIRGNSYRSSVFDGVKILEVVDGLVTKLEGNVGALNLDLFVQAKRQITIPPYWEDTTEGSYFLYWRNGLFAGAYPDPTGQLQGSPPVTNGGPLITKRIG
jgi:hypothetical protein